jgi:hypothetical protein
MAYKYSIVSKKVEESGAMTGKVLMEWADGKTKRERKIQGYHPEPFRVEPPITDARLLAAVTRAGSVAYRKLFDTSKGFTKPLKSALEAMLDEEQPR